MRYLRRQGGFTLVEMVLVLAIASLLLAGVLAGAGSIQNNTSFSSAIDAVRLQLKGVQNEASQSVVSNATATSGTSDQTNFGKLVELDNSSPAAALQMKTWTLVESADKTSLYKCDEKDVPIDQQVSFLNATNGANTSNTEAIVFGSNPNQTYIDPNFVDAQGAAVLPQCTPTASPAPTVPVTGVCAGFTRTQSNPQGSCPPPNPPPSPPAPCDANPALWQCGLYGQYYTGAINNPGRSLDSAYIDKGIGQLPGAVQSYPSFLPVLATRTITPPANVSVHWSGQILIGATDPPGLLSHTYCLQNSNIGDITIDGVASGTSGNPCVTVTPAQLTQGANWYPISIDFQTSSGSSPQSWLYEQVGGSKIEVPGGSGGDLETAASNQPVPPSSAFANGLYGQYYNDSNWGNRISTYTDPLIGDGGLKFSFDDANGFADNEPNIFVPTLEWNTANTSSAANTSVRWVGQILVDTSGSQTYCLDSDDGASLAINDDSGTSRSVINDLPAAGQATTRSCGTITLSAGWHNLTVSYRNLFAPEATARLTHLEGGSQVTVPHTHLRRPLDWSAVGSQGSCDPNVAICVNTNNSRGTWGSSHSSDGSCGASDHQGQITYTKTGLAPDNTYNMDISYFNEPNGTYPVPSGYSYLVCVAVNGTVLNGGNPVSLPISEPSVNPRTHTMSGITVPANGKVTVTLDWLNDSFDPIGTPLLCQLFGFGCPYDANFGVSRLDLYRNLTSTGGVSAAPPKSQPTAVAAATTPSRQTVAAGLLNLLLPTAQAAGGCLGANPADILDPQNYTVTCFGSPQTATLNLQVVGENGKGYIDINTVDNSIERRITN